MGTKIQKSFLAEIASPPFYEHVFEIKNFEDLKTIGDIIAEDNIGKLVMGRLNGIG